MKRSPRVYVTNDAQAGVERCGSVNANELVAQMLFQIEFFRRTEENPDGVTLRRNSGQFASERDVEIYGVTQRPETADGFRIVKDGIVCKIVSIRTER